MRAERGGSVEPRESGATSAAILNIADAVVEVLNAPSPPLPQTFTAERFYVPIHSLKEMSMALQAYPVTDALKVVVVPTTVGGELLDLAGHYMETFTVAIGVQQVIGIGPMTNAGIKAACDPLVFLCQQIIAQFAAKLLTGFSRARCTDHEWHLFVPADLDEKKLFTSVVTLTYKVGW
jgi:hypothetical protein